MEIKPPETNDTLKRFFGNGLVLRNKDNSIKTFELEPHEDKTLEVESYADNSSNTHWSGSLSTPIVGIFNEQGEKIFARNRT